MPSVLLRLRLTLHAGIRTPDTMLRCPSCPPSCAALPHEGGDKLVILRAREQSLLQVKRLQSVFGALLRDGIGLRKVNDQILRQRGVDAISRKVVLRHVEALLGAPPPPPRIGSMPALLLLGEKAAVGNGAANGASGAIKLVIVLGEIRRGLDKDLFSLCDEMVR